MEKELIKKTEIYGSFFLDKTEFAINVECVHEVVNLPDALIPMPLAPEYLLGIFNLRGLIIPVINLKTILKFSVTEFSANAKIAIIDYDGAKVGLIFDTTGEILRSNEEEKNDFHYSENSSINVILGVLKLNEGKRLLQILDPKSLVSIENVPQLRDYLEKNQTSRANLKHNLRHKCITFSVDNLKMAFEIKGIHEIVKVPEIERTALVSEICQGMITLRGNVIPIITFSTLLKKNQPSGKSNARTEDQRIIILKLENEFFGLLVDSVDSISTYEIDAIMPIPLLSKNRAAMFEGCLSLPNIGEVFLLNQSHILTNAEILDVTKGHSKIYQAKLSHESIKKSSLNRQVYISFRLGNLFGFPIKEVKEIINYTSDVFSAPGMPKFIKGMLNLRGKLVTVVDTRHFYGLTPASTNQEETAKILIFDVGEEKFGLVVDAVENILTVDENNNLKLPGLLIKDQSEKLQKDIKEIVQVENAQGKSNALIILNLSPLIKRIQTDIAA